jgi:hypothetical protein
VEFLSQHYSEGKELLDLPLFTLILYYLLKNAVESITQKEENVSNNKFWEYNYFSIK